MSETFVFTTRRPAEAITLLVEGLIDGTVDTCYRVPEDEQPYLRADIRKPQTESNGWDER